MSTALSAASERLAKCNERMRAFQAQPTLVFSGDAKNPDDLDAHERRLSARVSEEIAIMVEALAAMHEVDAALASKQPET